MGCTYIVHDLYFKSQNLRKTKQRLSLHHLCSYYCNCIYFISSIYPFDYLHDTWNIFNDIKIHANSWRCSQIVFQWCKTGRTDLQRKTKLSGAIVAALHPWSLSPETGLSTKYYCCKIKARKIAVFVQKPCLWEKKGKGKEKREKGKEKEKRLAAVKSREANSAFP